MAEPGAVLRDGTPIRIRPLRQSDRSWLAAAFAELSPQSRYRRFLAPQRALSERLLDQLVTAVDGTRHVALIAVADPGTAAEARIGVGRFVRAEDEGGAEVAVTVGDVWQGRGAGTLLMRALAARARELGVTWFSASIGVDNRPSVALLQAVGPVLRRTAVGQGLLEIVVGVPPEAP